MYKGYVALMKEHPGKVQVLAFPCNQFGGQEPGSNADVKQFAQGKYGFEGVLFDKIDVNGANAHPMWLWLQNKLEGTLGNKIKWNFSKFLIDKDGIPVKRFGPKDSVKSMEKDLMALM
eukprot:TRINITY_DN1394_c0_g1_i1.p5 TRINITY_DN1394_c0_g1~~TRINITY_DN1394_c0_g1_i1.p5  ORF type:complete len:118 (+),score=61.69 TRINITY_DN1394_c0_g1_i1:238-591(+)